MHSIISQLLYPHIDHMTAYLMTSGAIAAIIDSTNNRHYIFILQFSMNYEYVGPLNSVSLVVHMPTMDL